MNRLLIIEDDTHINQMLSELLTQAGYEVSSAYSGTEGLLLLQSQEFSMILLDLMLPGKSGQEVLEEIRQTSSVPVIVLTAVDTKESTIAFLRAGANDYLAKPFNNEELLVRIEVQLRNHTPLAQESFLHYKDITLDLEQFSASVAGQPINLSKREFEILHTLMKNPKKVFSKSNLYETVWEDAFYGDDNTINVHISKLRNKLAQANPDEEYIQTVWGIGFRMN
jgi:two-component system, OmpR family, response regulator